MWSRTPWTSRAWTFSTPVDWFPEVVERLSGAPPRARSKCEGSSDQALSWRPESGGWSVKENIGHLIDLEVLLDGRIDDFLAGRNVLRPADMENRATNQAQHNDRPIQEIHQAFDRARAALVGRLRGLEPDDFALTALHPRLKTPMRLIDSVSFACDHDDYHLARIAELLALRPAT